MLRDVNFFDDPQEAARAEREYRRRLLIRGVRGWFYAKRSPVLISAVMLVGAIAFAAGVVFLLAQLGIQSWGGRTFLAVFAAFGVFVGELRVIGALAFDGMNLSEGAREFVAHDTTVQRTRGREEASMDETWSVDPYAYVLSGREMWICALLSFGVWLVWDLIRRTPDLIAETYIDAHLLGRDPHLANQIARRNWVAEASAACAIYFGCFALFGALIAQGISWYLKLS